MARKMNETKEKDDNPGSENMIWSSRGTGLVLMALMAGCGAGPTEDVESFACKYNQLLAAYTQGVTPLDVSREVALPLLSSNSPLLIDEGEARNTLWSSSEKTNLTYCVSNKFEQKDRDQIKAAMQEAACAWQNVSDVKFSYVEAEVCEPDRSRIVFAVAPPDRSRFEPHDYNALAFLPQDRTSMSKKLWLRINMNFGQVDDFFAHKTMRHELGHVLGFRHAGSKLTCALDKDKIRPAKHVNANETYLDSVMRDKFCRSSESKTDTYEITPLDAKQAAEVYGPPQSTVPECVGWQK